MGVWADALAAVTPEFFRPFDGGGCETPATAGVTRHMTYAYRVLVTGLGVWAAWSCRATHGEGTHREGWVGGCGTKPASARTLTAIFPIDSTIGGFRGSAAVNVLKR